MSAGPGTCLAPAAGGTVVRIDAAGVTVVSPDDLAAVAAALRRAATRLSEAAAWLVRGGSWRPLGAGLAASAPSALGLPPDPWSATTAAARCLGRCAEQMRALAGRAQGAAQAYAAAEVRGAGLVNAAGAALGETPVLAAGLAAVGLAAAAGVLLTAPGRDALLPGVGDPVLGWGVRQLPADLTRDGRSALLVAGASGLVAGLAPGRAGTRPDVPATARSLLALTPRPGDVRVVPRTGAPQIAAPRSLAGVVALVSRTYAEGSPGADEGNPTGLVTVQRLDHPDGTRGWLVAIPGTQSVGFASSTATDMTTNLALVGGVDDDMTAGVLAAMHRAGVDAGEPVALVGHSQGGMVAAAVAATGAYTVRAVVTAGSPDIPAPLPAGVRVVALVHDEDAVPQLDARGWSAAPGVTTITRDLSADPGGEPGPALSHRLETYVRTAQQADHALAGRDVGLGEVLGPAGTTAVTRQYAVSRIPAPVSRGGGAPP